MLEWIDCGKSYHSTRRGFNVPWVCGVCLADDAGEVLEEMTPI